ncbi:putative S-adenosylmethionine-dependent methyltransferase [Gemmata sp. SH-PL17]|uniref:glycosyltransferase family protein n=1 Tax=Gemmata sp. SH-PL17 TaxID=1630693 RepID=UPI00078C6959|nr:glycosyltransferase [Gemmata sp. SH-PL17]AMV24175.1 putative S-adenosylmethionine-dependent methyltransferase [Gemmata sp. SH-PL17]
MRVCVIYDDRDRPETTGGYCLRALRELGPVAHARPDQLGAMAPADFDLFLRVDDGLEYPVPGHLRPLAWWAIDTHLGPDRCLTQARAADLTFAAQKPGAGALERAGVAGAEWLPLACDPGVHRPHPVGVGRDWCFVGNRFPGPRTELLELLARHLPNHFTGTAYFDEMARVYSGTRVAFNRSVRDDLNMRVFEALACGPLLVTNALPPDAGQDELFRDGEHLVTYSGPEDLLDKVRFYLARPEARERVARAGRAEVAARHTYRHRMERVLAAAAARPHTVPVSPPAARNPEPAPAFDPGYFEFDRPELLALVPETAADVVDLGCGAGRLGAALKARQACRVVGVEHDPGAAAAARARLDLVLEGDAEALDWPFPDHSFDAVVCGDVLEHLRDPLALLKRVRAWLRPEGVLVVSLPNVRHHTVVRALLGGDWTYEPAGLLDHTHLRFFTRREIEKLLFRAGFAVPELVPVPGPGYEDWAAAGRPGEVAAGGLRVGGLDPADAEEFYAYQWLGAARPRPDPDPGLTSVVIPTHNQLHFTRRCVDGIRLLTDEPYELVFVDNGSADGTPEYLRALAAADPRVRVVLNPDNRGFPVACNQGIRAAAGAQVLLLNNDTVPTTGWLARLLGRSARARASGSRARARTG